ncbi:hypothetical protein MNBD_GAMMA06-1852 [hydrothermal vent metagenome]|uniref:PEP-CTERM protein-sorting domain-containing protein n=1 Tax=hydrothermal vent metagenome TaxID=652676 RepID=A0A3B0WCI2_9ZZZZ
MNKHKLTYTTIKSLFASTLLLNSLPVFSDAVITNSDNIFTEGDYTLTSTNGSIDTGSEYGPDGAGVEIPSIFADSSFSGVSGIAGSEITTNIRGYIVFDDDRFTARVSSIAEVLDPLNQLSDVLADGEASVDFSFEISTPHTYTLTGNTSISGDGDARISILFDSAEFTQLDDTFSLTGTLAAGSYNFNSYNIAALGDTGRVLANYDFDLQLNEVPVPAAAWLFASGLIGLIGVSRRKSIKG